MARHGDPGFRPAIALAMALAFAACTRPTSSPPAPARPAPPPAGAGWNLLLVTLDTVRAGVLTRLGAPQVVAPNLERLVSEGVLWTKAETTYPMTLPAHCSILTGLYASAHGVRHNAQYALPPTCPTLASVLQESGYDTGAFVAAYPLAPEFGTDRGFQTYDADFDRTLGVNAERSGRQVNSVAIPWIVKPRQAPFFAWVHYFEAHFPYAPPEPFRSRFPANPYIAEVATADAALGELLSALGKSGIAEHTLVVVVSDHGEGLGQHEEPYHGLLLYETTVHALAVFHGGPLPRVPREIPFPTSVADVMPTALGLLGVRVPEGVQGIDLSAPVRTGGAPPARPGVYSETWNAFLDFGWNPLRAYRTADWRYIEAPTPELYNLAEDPHETRNLAPALKDRAAEMRTALLAEEPRLMRAGAFQDAAQPLSQEQMEKLASLGYVSGGAAVKIEPGKMPAGPDPKAMMPIYARYVEAGAALEQANPAAALPVLDEVIAKDPGNLVFRSKRAFALALLGRTKDAEREYRSLIRDHPTYPLAYWDLAILCEKTGQAEKAVEALQALRVVDPGFVGLSRRIADLLLAQGDERSAAEELQAGARTVSPREGAVMLVEAAKLRSDAGDREGAAALLREALKLDPGREDARKLLSGIEKAL